MMVKRSIPVVLFCVAAVLSLTGCGPAEGESFNPDDIAVKQPGSGPPPMNAPMTEESSTPK